VTALGGGLDAALEQTLGSAVRRASRLSGGDINDAFELELEDGRRLFVKTNRAAPKGMFQAEARGLAWLGSARALAVPSVVAVGDDASSFLVLELIEPGPRRRGFDEELGRALGALHRASPGAFGLDHDNFIGSLPQSNREHARWADFFQSERLEPQLRLASNGGRATTGIRRGFDRLFARLGELVGPEEPPARLHGDLWGGNLHVTGARVFSLFRGVSARPRPCRAGAALPALPAARAREPVRRQLRRVRRARARALRLRQRYSRQSLAAASYFAFAALSASAKIEKLSFAK
jgi:fructosamine-3-kinase